ARRDRALGDPRNTQGHRWLDLEGGRHPRNQRAHDPVPAARLQRGAALGCRGRRRRRQRLEVASAKAPIVSDFLAELISYVELGDREIDLLLELHPRLEPYFPAIA